MVLACDWWVKAGYPPFDPGADSYPHSGQVIRYYRKQMVWTETDGVTRRWTQNDLARVLDVSEVTVRLMETQNKGLDSISRRRMLAELLNIPPTLLGLTSLQQALAQPGTFTLPSGATVRSPLTQRSVEPSILALYRDTVKVYWDLHYTGTAHQAIDEIEHWMRRLTTDLEETHVQQPLAELLCHFHHLLAKINDDLCHYQTAFDHIESAMELADMLNNDELRAATFYRSGYLRFGQRKFTLAKVDLDAALAYATSASPLLQATIFSAAGLAHALVAENETDRTVAHHFFERAEQIVSRSELLDDPYFTRFNVGKYHLEHADALTTLGCPTLALESLSLADQSMSPSHTRRHAYINILRAEAYMHHYKPELDMATDLLTNAFGTSKALGSEYNIGYIGRLHTTLSTSTYGNAPDARDLGFALKQWQHLQIVS